MLCLLLATLPKANALDRHPRLAGDFDPYGGWNTLPIQPPTGFFEVANRDGRWWLVSPAGNAFFALGLNHLDWSEVEDRGLAWQYENDPELWSRSVMEDMRQAGLNTVGHASGNIARFIFLETSRELAKAEHLYFANRFSSDRDLRLPDVFDETWFWNHCLDIVYYSQISINDPYLIGYYMSEEPAFGDGLTGRPHGDSWPIKLAEQDVGTPGKAAFVALMKERYESQIAAFDAVWGGLIHQIPVEFGSWADVEGFTNFRVLDSHDPPSRDADELAMSVEIAKIYYPVAVAAIRDRDPNHLILGDRYIPEWNNMPCEVLEIAGQYVDLVALNAFGLPRRPGQEDLQRAHDCTGLPAIISDTKFVTPTPQLPNPFGFRVATHPKRGVGYDRLLRNEAAKSWVVGFNWCNYLDNPTNQNQGVRDQQNNEYWDWRSDFAAANATVWEIHATADVSPEFAHATD